MERQSVYDETQYTILLVDDNTANLNLLVDELFSRGYQLMVAKSGESALERAAIRKPDIILLDVRMPGMDGFETCRRFKADPQLRPIPIIFLSALSDADDKAQGLLVGGVDYITKPLEINDVLLRIRTHLMMRTLNIELMQSKAELEVRVAERTAELTAEIERRRRSDSQQAILLDVVRSQGTQLQLVTNQLMEMQQHRRTTLEQELQDEVVDKLVQLADQMSNLIAQTDNPSTRLQLDSMSKQLQHVQGIIHQVKDDLQNPLPEEIRLQANPLLKLSDREREVLFLLIKHYSTEEIATLLHVAPPTVRTYRYRISQKLGINDEDDLLAFALKFIS
jgi:CheY-like chemotaxis protein/DNA-binding CsgD family transcriptional regulator